MVYRIKEKFWSWGDNFGITDAEGTTCFLWSKERFFHGGTSYPFQDANGNELAFISQQLISWKPRYQITINGKVFAEVIKEWTWFNKKFTLDVPGPNDYTIDGSFLATRIYFSTQRSGRRQSEQKLLVVDR